MPIAGILFLGWKGASVLLLYFVDFMLDLAACVLMITVLDPEARAAWAKLKSVGQWIRNILGLLAAGIFLGAMFAFVFGMPVFFAVGIDDNPLDDRGFLTGLATHAVLAGWNFHLAYRYLAHRSRTEAGFSLDKAVSGRYQYVTLRWLAVYVSGLFLPFPLVMVAAFCAATIYAELNPRRFAELFNAPR